MKVKRFFLVSSSPWLFALDSPGPALDVPEGRPQISASQEILGSPGRGRNAHPSGLFEFLPQILPEHLRLRASLPAHGYPWSQSFPSHQELPISTHKSVLGLTSKIFRPGSKSGFTTVSLTRPYHAFLNPKIFPSTGIASRVVVF